VLPHLPANVSDSHEKCLLVTFSSTAPVSVRDFLLSGL